MNQCVTFYEVHGTGSDAKSEPMVTIGQKKNQWGDVILETNNGVKETKASFSGPWF